MPRFSLFFLCFFALFSSAQDAEKNTLPTLETTMVVTGSFQPESEGDAVYRTRVINRAEMEAKAATNLKELLRLEERIDLSQNGVFGSGLSINGLSGESVKILIDGVPVIGRLDGVIDLEQISLAGISRVEIIEGPLSVLYGTDAQAGVVNLISDRAGKLGPRSEINLQADDLGDTRQQGALYFGHEAFALGLTFSGRQFDGIDEDNSREQSWGARDQHQFGFQAQRYLRTLNLEYRALFSRDKLEDYGTLNQTQATDYQYRTARETHAVSLTGPISQRIYLDLNASHATYDRQRTSLLFTDGQQEVLDIDNNEFNNGFKENLVRAVFNINGLDGKLTTRFGLTHSREEGSGGRILDQNQTMTENALFAGIRYQFDNGLTVEPAFRLADHDRYDVPITPAINAKYDHASFTSRIGYSRGFRGPSLKQLFMDFTIQAGPLLYHITGNQDLQPEKGDHYFWDLQLQPKTLAGWDLEQDFRLFYNDIQQRIALSATAPNPQQPGGFERHYINIDQHKSRGGSWTIALNRDRRALSLNTTYTDTYNRLAEDQEVPEFNGRWDLSLKWRSDLPSLKSQLSLLYKFTGSQTGFVQVSPQRGAPPVTEETKVDGFHQMDFIWSWEPGRRDLQWQAGVKNIFDVDIRDAVLLSSGLAHQSQTLDQGRSIFIGLNWRSGR